MMTIDKLEEKLTADRKLETATFGMGCFWGPEARFGALRGVMRTRVGYAGGTTVEPTYRQMGDHSETVEIDFDPQLIRYEDVLRHFWRNHYPNRGEYRGRQYLSILRYHNEQQRKVICQVKQEMEQELGESIETEIAALDHFTLAEERHQKYYLKRYPRALEQLVDLFPENNLLVDSTFAARLNGFVKGFRSRDSLVEEIKMWEIKENFGRFLIERLLGIRW